MSIKMKILVIMYSLIYSSIILSQQKEQQVDFFFYGKAYQFNLNQFCSKQNVSPPNNWQDLAKKLFPDLQTKKNSEELKKELEQKSRQALVQSEKDAHELIQELIRSGSQRSFDDWQSDLDFFVDIEKMSPQEFYPRYRLKNKKIFLKAHESAIQYSVLHFLKEMVFEFNTTKDAK